MDKFFVGSAVALVAALGGFALGRLSTRLQARDVREESAKAVALAGIVVLEALNDRIRLFDRASADGVDAMRGYFLMCQYAAPESELAELAERIRTSMKLPHQLLTGLAAAAEKASAVQRHHLDIRNVLELSADWQHQRGSYRLALGAAREALRSQLPILEKFSPADTKQAIARAIGREGYGVV